MKTKLLFLIAILFVATSYGQTNVGGTLTSDTQWTLEGSPYILTSTVGVLNGNILTIDAGVEIQGDYDLLVKGTILIEGTLNENVTFSNTRLIFKDTNLTNSNIEYVTFDDDGGLQLADETEHNQDSIKNSGELIVSSSSFNNNSYARTKGYSTSAKLKLVSCNFEDSTVKGYYPRSEYIEIENCNINNSVVNSDSYNYGITLTNSSIISSDFTLGCCGANINIESCEITDSEFKDYNNYYTVGINNSILVNTLFDLEQGELSISNSLLVAPNGDEEFHVKAKSVEFLNVIFEGNENSKGINIKDLDFTSIITDCTFKNYKKAISLNETIDFTFLYKKATFQNTSNFTFKNNNLIGIKDYLFSNNLNVNIDATENYWGITDETIIANQIYDGLDDINYGIVNYSNYLTQPTGNAPISEPKNVFKGGKENGILITWSANEETNLAGYKIYYKVNDSDEYTLLADVGNVTSYITEAITTATIIAVKAYNTDADGDDDFIKGDESVFSLEAENIFKNVSLSSNTICSGETVQLDFDSNYSFSDTNEFTLQISDASESFETATNIQTISTVEEGFSFTLPETLISGQSYSLRINSSDLAVVSEVFDIITYNNPDTDFEITTNACSSDIVTVTYTGASEFYGADFSWDFNGATIVSGSNYGPYELQWQTEGEKTITLEVAENGCLSSNSEVIIIKQTPVASFSIQESVCGGDTIIVEFTETISETAIYSWDFDGATIVSGSDAGPYEINWGDSYGEKNVSLSVSDNGCISELVEKAIDHNPYPVGTIELNNQICSGETTSITLIGDFTATTSYTWNFNGGIIVSGNGSGPYEILWNTSGVKNVTVSIEDNNCSTFLSEETTVLETPKANFEIATTICGEQIVTVNYAEIVDEAATYIWDFDEATIISGSGAGPYEILWGKSFGEKTVTLSVSNNGCTSETNSKLVQYNALPTISFEAEETVCYNQDYTIEYKGENYTDVYWYFGEATVISGSGVGPYKLSWNTSGEKSVYFQAINNGCFITEEINVTVLPELIAPNICIVTVDEETSKNKLVWDYNAEILSQFGIYKETNISGVYELVSYVDGSESTFIDVDSSPTQRSNRYKISALDNCDSETVLSEYHKTIHLTISKGTGNTWNLIWDNYEGVDFSTYKIYRNIDDSGFELLTEIPNNLNSYTDIDVTSSNVSYIIEVVSSESCGTQLSGKGNTVNNTLIARSNIASSEEALSVKDNLYDKFNIYPNPALNYLQIDTSFNKDELEYELLSIVGQSIKKGSLKDTETINVKDLQAGQYLIRISTKEGQIIKKFIKQ